MLRPRRPSARPPTPCRSGGSGAAPPARTRSPRPPRRATRRRRARAGRAPWTGPGTVPTWSSRSAAGTSSPVSTVAPSANSSVKPDRSRPASRSRNVSATATRSRCWTTSASRPSSPISNSTLPSSVGTTVGHVAHARHRDALAGPGAPAQRGGGDALGRGDREPGADPGAVVDRRRLAQPAGQPGDHLEQVLGDVGDEPRLLRDQRDLLVDLVRGSACGSRRRSGP